MNNRRPSPAAAEPSETDRPWPPNLIGQARIIDMAFRGEDLMPLITSLSDRVHADPNDAAALMDLASIHIVLRKSEHGFVFQQAALGIERVYRQPIGSATAGALRVLMFAGPGDFMANIPVQFLIDNADIALDLVYVLPGRPMPQRVPDHDIAIVGVAESDDGRPILEALSSVVRDWPAPVLLAPEKIAALSREALWRVLEAAPGVTIPATVRVPRAAVAHVAAGQATLDAELPAARYPVILRPVGSHAGRGLEKIESASQLATYLEAQTAEQFYLSQFVDYRNADGLYRKYRIAFVDGQPFACHMAIGSHWMLHYLNAGMEHDGDKRAEEAGWFDTFDSVFAPRHREAFHALHGRIGLEYFVIDCAEAPTGELLLFEADTAMVVHSMDPEDLFPYKGSQMARVFKAFQTMVQSRAGRVADSS